MNYHVKFSLRLGGESKIDMTEPELQERFVLPYLNGADIMINGKTLKNSEITRVKIVRTPEPIKAQVEALELVESRKPRTMANVLATPVRHRVIDEIKDDVTDDFLSKPPKQYSSDKDYVNVDRIEELKKSKKDKFELLRLVRICEELNLNWREGNYISVISLVRTILHHVPPIFGVANFEQVANNYNGGLSFKKSMTNLLQSSKNIADHNLHSQAQKNEALPNNAQVDFRSDLDFLLAEIVKLLK